MNIAATFIYKPKYYFSHNVQRVQIFYYFLNILVIYEKAYSKILWLVQLKPTFTEPYTWKSLKNM